MEKHKNYTKKILQYLSPLFYTKIMYLRTYNKKLDLKKPSGFNEKILWLKHYWKHPLIVKCSDKYRMRDYVRECGLEKILPELHGVYENSGQIDWNELPNKFALKCNHGCGYNVICNDKSKLDQKLTSMKLDRWLKSKFGYVNYEPHYLKIKPLIICEEFIENNKGFLPNDYKIYCFSGEPKLVLACTERDTELRLEWYDLEWNVLDVGLKPNEQKIKKPDCFDEMVAYAKQLSTPFPFVRVDFYDLDSKPILGEMTFTPAAGMAAYYTEWGNQYLGEMLLLPEKL